MNSPYGVIADVKMLNFFRHIGQTGAIVLGVLAVASLLIQNFWCRYLCPYGALLGIASFFSPARIRRNPETCIDCAKCVKACPSALPVDTLVTIKSAECTGCLECVAVCPAKDTLGLSLPQIPVLSPRSGYVTAVGPGGGNSGALLRHRWICQDCGPLGFARAAGHLSATGSQCGSGGASHAGGELRAAAVALKEFDTTDIVRDGMLRRSSRPRASHRVLSRVQPGCGITSQRTVMPAYCRN